MFQTRSMWFRLCVRRESNERGKETVLVAGSSNTRTKVPAHAVACVSFNIKQLKKLRACNVLVVPSVKACLQKGD